MEKDIKRIKICVEKMNKRVNNEIRDSNISSFNRIVDFVEEKRNKFLENNDLTHKLYLILLTNQIERYNSSLYDKIPIKELHKQLELPLSYFQQILCIKANDIERNLLFRKLKNDTDTHPALETSKVKKKEINILFEAIKCPDNYKKLFGLYWKQEEINHGIQANVSELIKNQLRKKRCMH